MFCSRCGLPIEEGNRFCQGCGMEVSAATFAAATSSPGATVAPRSLAAGAGAPVSPSSQSAINADPTPLLRYAGFWERFAAYLIDGLILAIPSGLVIIVLLTLLGGFGLMMRGNSVPPEQAAAAVGPVIMGLLFAWVFLLVITWLYSAGMESSARQATVGKSVMALRVTNIEGQRISFAHATGRFFAKIVSGMIPLAIGYIMAAFTAKKQALHDLIAGTLVLKK